MIGTLRILLAILALTALPAFGAIKKEGDPSAVAQGPIPELKPPQGVLPEEPAQRNWWAWVIAGACFAAAAAILWPRRATPVAKELPFVRATRELQRHRHPDPVLLGAILREYFVASFPVPGPGQTFQEMAAHLAAHPRTTPAIQARFTRMADPLEIAKFAPHATPQDMERLRDEALEWLVEAEEIRRPPVTIAAP
jgi:hypothetical protein